MLYFCIGSVALLEWSCQPEVGHRPRAAQVAGTRWSESAKGSAAGSRRGFKAVDIDPPAGMALHSACLMQLEFHQFDRRWEHLRVRHLGRQRRLLASLAESGQQTPIVVVAAEGQPDRYVVIDGYKRILALEQLGRDTVEAVVLADERGGGSACWIARCVYPNTKPHWRLAGYWQSWSGASTTGSTS